MTIMYNNMAGYQRRHGAPRYHLSLTHANQLPLMRS